MSRITVAQAQGWLEPTKLTVASLDTGLLDQIETEVLAQLGASFDTSSWVDSLTTPTLVQVIIAKTYAAWVYRRQYSEDTGASNDYANKLIRNASDLMEGLLQGTIDLPGITPTDPSGQPGFYPTDASSYLEPTSDDASLGPARFSMGMIF